MVFPKAKVFRMTLAELMDQMRLRLRQVNQKARAWHWQDHYVSPKTGEVTVCCIRS